MCTYTQTDIDFINKNTLHYYCKTNETLIRVPVRGFVLEFPGLDGNSCIGGTLEVGDYTSNTAKLLAEKGILLAYLFTGPWNWMNKGAVRIVNAVVAAIKDKFSLEKDAPWVAMGGSMGGLGALIYTAECQDKPTACAAVCPCVNVLDRLDVTPEFPRTFLHAIAAYEQSFLEGLKSLSPTHRIADMPDVNYLIVNDCADELFPEAQLDEYVFRLKSRGLRVQYDKLPDCKHGKITKSEWERLHAFLLAQF